MWVLTVKARRTLIIKKVSAFLSHCQERDFGCGSVCTSLTEGFLVEGYRDMPSGIDMLSMDFNT